MGGPSPRLTDDPARAIISAVSMSPHRACHVPGLAFFALQDELGRLLGRKVDLHKPASLSDHFRDQVLREAEPAYVAA
jgi:predicted nucleotidyltransferase